MKKILKVAFTLSDPIGTDSNGDVLTIESPESEIQIGRIRAHLHALNTDPKYKRWIFKHLSKRKRREHKHAADILKELLTVRK